MKKNCIIPFFVTHRGCPFQCIFCNQWAIGGVQEKSEESIEQRVKRILCDDHTKNKRIEVAFFGGSFTGMSINEQSVLLDQALGLKKSGLIDGIRLSTRPDYINKKVLDFLFEHEVSTIELGIQSFADNVLEQSHRGYTAEQAMTAVELIREYPFEIVLQLMLGLPGDDEHTTNLTARRVIAAKPDAIRIYPAVVLRKTELEKAYNRGEYIPWTLERTVEVGAYLLGLFLCHGIKVIRMGLQANENLYDGAELVAGPYHPAYREMVENHLYLEQINDLIKKLPSDTDSIDVFFNLCESSKIIGQKRLNHHLLKKKYPDIKLQFFPQKEFEREKISISTNKMSICSSRQEFVERYRIDD